MKSAVRSRNRRRIAAEAVKQAEKTNARINELSQAAGRIGDVVKLITSVAEQTNLLALNATIEAARAGEAGRGFAVVASEVKALAAQTANATEEIGTQIASMQGATQESVTAIKEIGGTIGQHPEIASTIAAAVEGRVPRPGDRAQCAAGCARYDRGRQQDHGCKSWCRKDRLGVLSSTLLGTIAIEREQSSQARGRQDSSRRCGLRKKANTPEARADIRAACLRVLALERSPPARLTPSGTPRR